jgi:hypothetical protein
VDTKIIQLGDDGQRASRDMVRRLEALLERHPAVGAQPLQGHLRTLESIDRQYGGEGPLPLEDVETLVAATLTDLAYLERDLRGGSPADLDEAAELTLAVALWAIRHAVPLTVVEPVANALAIRSNGARTPAELSAVFGLMHGVIAHAGPDLAADLERSNPERPWRILHANLAITAIRTEDPALMDMAFDALDEALPDERGSFYAEALSLALGPRVAPVVRERIEARYAKWHG